MGSYLLQRAVYSRAGTILVDDVLSSLDATTSQYVYAHCLRGDLLRNRRLIMVSHNVSLLLPATDLAIQLKDGSIARSGTPEELRETLLQEEDHTITEEFNSFLPPDGDMPKSLATSTSSRRIYEEEHQEKGNVQFSNYRFVIRNVGGKGYWIGLILLIAGPEFLRVLMRFVVKHWTSEPSHNDYWIRAWAGIATLRVLATSAMWFWLYGNERGGFTQRGAAKMHNAMVDSILNAPLRYFDRTPEGKSSQMYTSALNLEPTRPDMV
jgi:ABC-type multidrug transport system fused ATPase/permease subunit